MGSSCHRYPAFAPFPPAGPALWARACRREPRDPGLPFRLLAGGISNTPCFGKQKTLRSFWLGRVRGICELSMSLRRDRSHEPGVRYRLAASHSAVGRVFRTRIASHDSCSTANTMFAKAAGNTPVICRCQHERRAKIATVDEIQHSRRLIQEAVISSTI